MTCCTKERCAKYNIAFFALLAATMAFLLWKAPYGFANCDESFYLAEPYRLWQGDALLRDEWHPAQLFSFLVYPAVSLYISVFGSTDGMFLSFRYLYVFVQTLAAVYLYIRLRKISHTAAILSSLCFMLYAPLNMMALSYNTLCLMLLSAAFATLCTTDGGNGEALLSGLLFAGAVLCCPYLVALFAVYTLCVLIPCIRKRLNFAAFELCFWALSCLGAALLAFVFVAFVLSRTSVSEIVRALPYFFNDPEHISSFGTKLLDYARSVYQNFWFESFSLALPILLSAVLIGRKKLRLSTPTPPTPPNLVYIIAAMIITAAYFAYYFLCDRTVNYLMFPLNILGVFAYLLCTERDKRPFVFILVPGIMYSVCAHFASNLNLMTISSALSVAMPASIYYILHLASELMGKNRRVSLSSLCAAALVMSVIMQMTLLVYFRGRYTMWDADTAELSSVIPEGSQKGIITTADKCGDYRGFRRDFDTVKAQENTVVLYYTGIAWPYLEDSARMGAYSPWLSSIRPEVALNNLRDFWQLYPERIPESIYVSSVGAEDVPDALRLPGYSVTELERGVLITGEK